MYDICGPCSVYANINMKVLEVICVSSNFRHVHEMWCSRYEKCEVFHTFGVIDEGKFVVAGVRKTLGV